MSVAFEPTEHSHRRWNPLTRTWVLVSPHRMKRPWQGQQEAQSTEELPSYDPKCYLCPGNARSGGDVHNDQYESTFVFENDFAAVLPDAVAGPDTGPQNAALFKLEPARGKCFVTCFHPDHSKTLAQMTVADIVTVLHTWRKLYIDAAADHDWLRYVQIFENKGSAMGCSNPHPHCQAWCLGHIPSIAQTILDSLAAFAVEQPLPAGDDAAPLSVVGRPHLILSYAHAELHPQPSPRVIFANDHWVALVPYWATWPFEAMLLPHRRQILSVADLTDDERTAMADAIRRMTCRYDSLFQTAMPYSGGLYQLPVHGRSEYADVACLFMAFYPPLLRSATVRKFQVGFEMFAEPQRDLTPEQAAGRLRECSEVHYKA